MEVQMKKFSFGLLIVLVIIAGCCKKIEIPPVIKMEKYEPTAIVNVILKGAEGNLSGIATQRLIEFMTCEQPGNRILEIGTLENILEDIGSKEINPDAIKAIGEKYKVKTIIIGEIFISDVQPQMSLNFEFPYVSAKANVSSEMTVRLYETEFGATIWTGSSWAKDEVGNLSIFKNYVSFNAENPDDAYGNLVNELIKWATLDFRKTYECEK